MKMEKKMSSNSVQATKTLLANASKDAKVAPKGISLTSLATIEELPKVVPPPPAAGAGRGPPRPPPSGPRGPPRGPAGRGGPRAPPPPPTTSAKNAEPTKSLAEQLAEASKNLKKAGERSSLAKPAPEAPR